MDNTLHIEGKKVWMYVPYFGASPKNADDRKKLIENFSQIKGLKLEITEDKIEVFVRIDFDKWVPESIWNFGNRLLPEDVRIQMRNELIAGIVEQLLPKVMKTVMVKSEELITKYGGKNE